MLVPSDNPHDNPNAGFGFADDRIIVTISQDETDTPRAITVADFPEIQAESVTLLMTLKSTDDEKIHSIVIVKLKNPGKNNVLAAISLLAQRDDIVWVGRDDIIPLA